MSMLAPLELFNEHFHHQIAHGELPVKITQSYNYYPKPQVNDFLDNEIRITHVLEAFAAIAQNIMIIVTIPKVKD